MSEARLEEAQTTLYGYLSVLIDPYLFTWTSAVI